MSSSSADNDEGVMARVDTALEALARNEPRWQALVAEPGRGERLRAAATRLEDTTPDSRGALHGALVAVKDVFHVDGLPTGGGSRLPPEVLAGAEATSVSRLRRAGALILGKAVSTEFAYFAPGPTHNPRRFGHTPGGSSSGSAAAVAAGYCPLALGTQTIGSVTRPASFCGVVGFKPTFGRIPIDGVIPLAPSFDHVGVLAASVDWATRAAAVLCDGWGDGTHGDREPVLAVADGPGLHRATPEMVRHFEGVVERLQTGGLKVLRVDPWDDLEALDRAHQRVLAAEVAAVHADWLVDHRHLYHATTLALVDEGRAVTPTSLATARQSPARVRQHLHGVMDNHGIDLWLSPSAPGPAPEGIGSTGDPVMNRPWTHAGVPTLGLPSGSSASGLPLGLQVAARAGHDEALLAWGAGLENLLPPVGEG